MSCRNFSRGLLVFTNVLFMLLGGILLYMGVDLQYDRQLQAFSYNGMSSGIVCCGILILLLSLLGCCGAHWDSKAYLLPYSTLVIVSVAAQMVLAYFMIKGHKSVSLLIDNNYSPSGLPPHTKAVYTWLRMQFNTSYAKCNPTISFLEIVPKRSIHITCMNHSMKWFSVFAKQFCSIHPDDLLPGSSFLQCTGSNKINTSSLEETAVFCSCETKLLNWAADQILLIGCIAGLIAGFQVFLIVLSCFVMCSKRRRRHGYQEIRMPVKQNLYPTLHQGTSKGYYYQKDDVQGAYGQSNAHLEEEQELNYDAKQKRHLAKPTINYGSPLLGMKRS